MTVFIKKSLAVVFAAMMAYFILLSLLGMSSPALVLSFFAILCAAIYYGSRLIKYKLDEKHLGRFILAGYLLLFAAFCAVGVLIVPYPNPDIAAIYYSIPDVLDDFKINGDYADYFVRYYMNIFFLLVLSGVYRIASLFGIPLDGIESMDVTVVFSAMVMIGTVILLCKSAGHIAKDRRAEASALLICALCLPLYLNVPIFYTHSMAMLFASAEMYILSRWASDGKLCWVVFSAIVAAAGFLIAASVSIAAIAAFISLFFIGGFSGKKRIVSALIFLLVVALVTLIPVAVVFNSGLVDFSRREALSLPVETWVCVSLHGDGGYCEECVEYASSFPDVASRRDAMRQRLADIVGSYSLKEFLSFTVHKNTLTWCDGTFESLIYLQWPIKTNFTNRIFSGTSTVLSGYCNAFLLLMYVSGLWDAIRDLKNKFSDVRFWGRLTVFGMFLFFLFMESASRRTVMLLPFFIFNAAALFYDFAKKDRKSALFQK